MRLPNTSKVVGIACMSYEAKRTLTTSNRVNSREGNSCPGVYSRKYGIANKPEGNDNNCQRSSLIAVPVLDPERDGKMFLFPDYHYN